MIDDSYDPDDGYESEEDFLDDTERREAEEEQWKCQLGSACLVADPFHHRDECFDEAMAKEMFDEPPPPEPCDPADDMSLS